MRVERLQDIPEEDCVAEGRYIGDTMEGDYQEFWKNYLKATVIMKDAVRRMFHIVTVTVRPKNPLKPDNDNLPYDFWKR